MELNKLLELANNGDASAQSQLGCISEFGNIGVKQDYEEAVKWHTLAAEQGDEYSQYRLGHMYQVGRGVKQDYAKAIQWYTAAANQNCALAQNSLGHMYERGLGVPQDYAEAVKWYTLAAEKGHPFAKKALTDIKHKIEEEINNE